jgi:hypothetical protein
VKAGARKVYVRVARAIREADDDAAAAKMVRSLLMGAAAGAVQHIADELQIRADAEDRHGADTDDQAVGWIGEWLDDSDQWWHDGSA